MTKATDNSILSLPYRERVKLAQERLREIRYPKYEELPKSARVLAAEKVLAEWSAKNEAYYTEQMQAHRSKANAVKDALILGDAAEAVKLLQQMDRY